MNEIEKIREAAKGLYFISETDHPFELRELSGEGSVEQRLIALFNREPGTAVEKQDIAYFLRNMIKTYEGATAEDEQRAEKFRNLKAVLEQTLTAIEVYRLGEISIDAAIIGETREGKTLVLSTKLVET